MDAAKYPHARFTISLLGILIVFLTFVVKEDFRERMKTRSDAINSARGTFLIRGEIEALQDVVSRAGHKRDVFHEPKRSGLEGGWSFWGYGEENEREFVLYGRDVSNAEVTLDNIGRLEEGVANREDEEKAGEIRARIRDFRNDLVQIDRLAQNPEVRNDLKRQGWSGSDSLVSKANDALSNYFKIVQDTDALAWNSLHHAEEAHAVAERKLQLWSRISYFIQTIGVVLSFAGLLIGVEPKSEA